LILFIVDVQLSTGANWTAAGEAFDVAQIPGAKGDLIAVIPQPNAAAGVNSPSVAWDSVTKKLLCYGTAASATGLTAIADSTNLSTMKTRALCFVTGTG
jgi:hypothetical protein